MPTSTVSGPPANASAVLPALSQSKRIDAQVKAAKATAEVYRLNLGYTKVTSPIDGQVSRYYYSVGNLVGNLVA